MPKRLVTPELSGLVTVGLKYGSAASPLKIVAFAELAAKVLYLIDEPLLLPDVSGLIAEAIGSSGVPTKQVEEGLNYLVETGRALCGNSNWKLTDQARTRIAESIAENDSRLSGVLRRHFPAGIDQTRLSNWFREAASMVFGSFGDECVAAICRNQRFPSNRFASMEELLSPSIEKHGLRQFESALVGGFISFMQSREPQDATQFMSFGQAMFSARLVASDIGADPYTLEEFRGSCVLVDTNVLIALTLEKNRHNSAFPALSAAMKLIGVRLCCIRPTIEEYKRAMGARRGQILKLVGEYHPEIISELTDDFLSTARARGCITIEDYERFFDDIAEPPDSMSDGFTIDLLEDEIVQTAIDNGVRDERLRDEIQRCCLERRRWGKGENSLNHDASLVHVVERERKGEEKCWALTLDRGFQACSMRRAGPQSMPACILFDALVEILALESSGPGILSTDFAPILSQMMLNQCEPSAETFRVVDLETLSEINNQASELPPDETRELVRIVAKARIEGKSSSDTGLKLEVNRAFQTKILNRDERVRDANDRATRAESLAGEERSRRLRAEAKSKLLLQCVWRVPVAVLVAWIIMYFYDRNFQSSGEKEVLGYLVDVIPFLLSSGGLLWHPYKRYRQTISESGGSETGKR